MGLMKNTIIWDVTPYNPLLFSLGRENYGAPPSSAEVKNGGAIHSFPHVFMAWCLIN
jgi:hypothetical protein